MDYNYTRMELGKNHHRSEFKSVHTELNEELLKKTPNLENLACWPLLPHFYSRQTFFAPVYLRLAGAVPFP